jgi:hypothetical protein
MATWAFYNDAGLTNLVTGINSTATTTVHHLYFGSATTGRKIFAQTTGNPVQVTVADSATGGHATTAVKLSLTTGGLAGATPGAALTLASGFIAGGAANRKELYAQVTDAVGSGVASTELSLVLTDCWESAT